MEHKLVPYEAVTEIQARSVLVVAPHADDEVLGCGGAIARHVELGVPVRVIVVTDGALGHSGEARAEVMARRQAESRAAAGVLGYGEPEFWQLPDQGLRYGEPLIEQLQAAMSDVDLVYAPSILEIHPDHRILGMAAAEALRRAGGDRHMAFYEVGAPLRPNLLLDITKLAERKREAMRCFATQLESQAYDQHIDALNRYRTYTLPAQVAAAEGFVVVAAEGMASDPLGIYRSEYMRQDGLGLRPDARNARLVSVIVRSMGRASLQDALDSVALQTWPNIEVIVVDGRGGHAPLPRRCGRFPLTLVSRGERLGRSRAANVGLEAARGELAIFLDDDDVFLPNHVARLAEALRDAPDARAAYAGVRVEGDAGVIDIYDEGFPAARMMAWNHLPVHAVLFERSLFEEGCRFDEDRLLYEDWDFWLQVQARARMVRTPGISAIYRVHLGGSPATDTDANSIQEERRSLWAKWLRLWSPTDMERLVADIRSQREATRTLEFTVRDLRRELAERDRELAQRDLEIADGKASLEAIRASTSWRLTAPVRFVLGLARQGRKAA